MFPTIRVIFKLKSDFESLSEGAPATAGPAAFFSSIAALLLHFVLACLGPSGGQISKCLDENGTRYLVRSGTPCSGPLIRCGREAPTAQQRRRRRAPFNIARLIGDLAARNLETPFSTCSKGRHAAFWSRQVRAASLRTPFPSLTSEHSQCRPVDLSCSPSPHVPPPQAAVKW